MRRRELIALLGGAAVARPLGARAQQSERVRRIAVLYNLPADDDEAQARHAAFLQALQQLGWTVGRNVRIDTRWGGGGDPDRLRKLAAELVALAPECILATGSAGVAPLLQATRTIPIVFVIVPGPVGAGVVRSLARPGGNATGFTSFEYGVASKWLELLKQAAPTVTRSAVLRDPTITAGIGWWGAIQSAAPALSVQVTPVDVLDLPEMERAVAEFARSPNGSLVVTGSPSAVTNRDVIISLAARYSLPTVYFERFFVKAGGLLSYGPDYLDEYRQAAGYANRILRGEKPADLPVQAPTKYQLVINLKTAKALGLDVPATLLARADEVIE